MQIRRTSHFLVALLLVLVFGCVAPQDKPIPHEPTTPIVQVVYETQFSPRGTEVELPDYIAAREELLLLALQEIDDLGIARELPGWIIHIVRPTDPESVSPVDPPTIRVRWRTKEHEPHDQMLPNLQSLFMTAAFD